MITTSVRRKGMLRRSRSEATEDGDGALPAPPPFPIQAKRNTAAQVNTAALDEQQNECSERVELSRRNSRLTTEQKGVEGLEDATKGQCRL